MLFCANKAEKTGSKQQTRGFEELSFSLKQVCSKQKFDWTESGFTRVFATADYCTSLPNEAVHILRALLRRRLPTIVVQLSRPKDIAVGFGAAWFHFARIRRENWLIIFTYYIAFDFKRLQSSELGSASNHVARPIHH